MGQRYDVLSTRKYTSGGQEKTAWTNVGVAFEQKDGKGFSINLHAIPVPDKESGEIRLVMRIPLPRDDDQRGGGRNQGGGFRGPDGADAGGPDDVPFAPRGNIG